MTLKRVLCASTMAAGIGVAGLLGMGLSTASADPGPQCNAPGRPPCGQDNHWNQGPGDNRGPGNDGHGPGGPGPVDWNHRGIDEGRRDHQPFNWNGQQVNPVFDQGHNAWGFWFLGMWIPL